ncbi:response regulator transcription factor [Oceanirhabdus sp. W0125-5]|uniref:response regulator transcription factor n=1 Tax=Oceanirhabdus sp. W0125-5 TaxID=2999116 RepID=UPI0022F2BA5C|nr:response regulator transcription factor [Oceanirhabdus sp. W0125-5]WBW97961.1 response regulator transcription factor [Oceanirhabdus sp. W0125-5]
MSNTILIVEDEFRMRKLIKDYFKKENYIIIEAADGPTAIKEFKNNPNIDIVILDIMIPEMDGYTVCEEIREISNVPIIMLTAKGEEEDKLLGFELGADEYVTKPFSPKVLVARVKALLKRSSINILTSNNHIISIGNLKVNTLEKSACIGNSTLQLSPKEYDLLEYMSNNSCRVLSRDSLLNNVWGYDYFGDARTVDTHIKRLREKLASMSHIIKTVRGKGYMLKIGDE